MTTSQLQQHRVLLAKTLLSLESILFEMRSEEEESKRFVELLVIRENLRRACRGASDLTAHYCGPPAIKQPNTGIRSLMPANIAPASMSKSHSEHSNTLTKSCQLSGSETPVGPQARAESQKSKR